MVPAQDHFICQPENEGLTVNVLEFTSKWKTFIRWNFQRAVRFLQLYIDILEETKHDDIAQLNFKSKKRGKAKMILLTLSTVCMETAKKMTISKHGNDRQKKAARKACISLDFFMRTMKASIEISKSFYEKSAKLGFSHRIWYCHRMWFGHLNATRELQTSEIHVLTTTSASASEWQEALIETSKKHLNITKKQQTAMTKELE